MFLIAGLGEFRIRDLNDEINKLMREKRHWEVQIKSLGGPDHARVGPKMLDQDGKEVPGNRGYKYFGAAKDLPGKKTYEIVLFYVAFLRIFNNLKLYLHFFISYIFSCFFLIEISLPKILDDNFSCVALSV